MAQNPRRTKAQKQLDAAISEFIQRKINGIQFSVMDLHHLTDACNVAHAEATAKNEPPQPAMETALDAAIAKYRKN